MSTVNLVKAAEESQEPLEDYSPDALAAGGSWMPSSIRDLEWALECVAESEEEIAQVDAQLADVIKRATARADKLKAMAQRRAHYFSGRVAEYAEAHRSELLTGTKKSRELIAGRIGWRKKGGRIRVEDKAALAAWLETQPVERGLARVKLEPDMAALQANCKETGEVPPGCTFEEERDEVYVEAEMLRLPKETP